MTTPIVIANWKANKTLDEAISWVNFVGEQFKGINAAIILCPPAIFIAPIFEIIKNKNHPILIGSQDVSVFDSGPYTGEISASQYFQFCQFAIIGHSERRVNFNEDSTIINQKIRQALSANLTPIICIDDGQENEISEFKNENLIIAYEPPSAISTNLNAKNEDPQKVQQVASKFSQMFKSAQIIYGGSVNADNTKDYLKPPIAGVLVGNASLSADSFLSIVQKVSS